MPSQSRRQEAPASTVPRRRRREAPSSTGPYRYLQELLPVIELSRFDAENYIRRLDLRTVYEPGGRGKPRLFSKENALELGLIAGLSGGRRVPLTAAVETASVIMAKARKGRRPKFHIVRDGDLASARFVDSGDEVVVALFGAREVSILDIGRIFADVERLFSEDSQP